MAPEGDVFLQTVILHKRMDFSDSTHLHIEEQDEGGTMEVFASTVSCVNEDQIIETINVGGDDPNEEPRVIRLYFETELESGGSMNEESINIIPSEEVLQEIIKKEREVVHTETSEALQENKLQQITLQERTLSNILATNSKPLQSIQMPNGTTYYLPKDIIQPTAITLTGADGSTTQVLQLPPHYSIDDLINSAATNDSVESGNVDETSSDATCSIKMDTIQPQVSAESSTITPLASLTTGKGFICEVDGCNKYFATATHLKTHLRTHTGNKPYVCDEVTCQKAFNTMYSLKSHKRLHTGERPYRCTAEGCPKAFRTSGDLQKHARTHTGERPYACPFESCTKRFTTSNILKVHIRTHTGEKPYTCPAHNCGKKFSGVTNYRNHMRIHTGERPYVCSVAGCGKSFTEYSSLYKHQVVHTHKKPYSCPHCGKSYRQISSMTAHKHTTHNDHTPVPVCVVDMNAPLTQAHFSSEMEPGEGELVIHTGESQTSREDCSEGLDGHGSHEEGDEEEGNAPSASVGMAGDAMTVTSQAVSLAGAVAGAGGILVPSGDWGQLGGQRVFILTNDSSQARVVKPISTQQFQLQAGAKRAQKG